MANHIWDAAGERFYSAGIDRGVYYPLGGPGVPWNGLISITENEEGLTETVTYIDGEKKFNRLSVGEFSATIQAFTYPDEMDDEELPYFNLTYRTRVGTDLTDEFKYQIHLVYNALATPTAIRHTSLARQESVEPFSWTITTKPTAAPGVRPSSHFIIDTNGAYPWTVVALENLLYGNDESEPTFPTMDELFELFEANTVLRVIDHGDGTWTAISRDDHPEVLVMLDETTFQIDWESAEFVSDNTYTLATL